VKLKGPGEVFGLQFYQKMPLKILLNFNSYLVLEQYHI